MNDSDRGTLQIDLDRLEEWALENTMKVNPDKSKAVSFTKARVKDPLNCVLGDQKFPEASRWAGQVSYTVQKAWKAPHFLMLVHKKGNSNMKSLACVSLVRPILEYGASCWDPNREGRPCAKERG